VNHDSVDIEDIAQSFSFSHGDRIFRECQIERPAAARPTGSLALPEATKLDAFRYIGLRRRTKNHW
jgi:hypothetical protein